MFTHDSIGLGEDGPTHQPIEHLMALRAIPQLTDFRPADANETAACWRWRWSGSRRALWRCRRQDLPVLDAEKYKVIAGVREGRLCARRVGRTSISDCDGLGSDDWR